VDANTASASLLAYVSGINHRLAEEVVRSRDEKGPFVDRTQIKKVKGFGEKTYEQAIGFMKIPGGANLLDNTFIHPESYAVVERLLQHLQIQNLDKAAISKLQQLGKEEASLKKLAKELDTGLPTLQDILDNLIKPGRDLRDDLPKPLLRQDVLAIEDLKEGMLLNGTVRNVVDFGAFVDIGVKQDGLVHISEMADKYVQNPHSVLSVGDVIAVRIKSVDLVRKRIALTLRGINN
jgi:protein Tex